MWTWGQDGKGQWQILKVSGTGVPVVWLPVPSELKAKAIALILNAPENNG